MTFNKKIFKDLHKSKHPATFEEELPYYYIEFFSKENDLIFDPLELVVDKIYRFEGETNIDDEAMLFALSCLRNNIKGTYVVAYGPSMSANDSEIVLKLEKKNK